MARVNSYRGMEGRLGPKEKEAVDGLIRLLSEVGGWDVGRKEDGTNQSIEVIGKFSRCRDADDPQAKDFPLWRVVEVAFLFRGNGMTGGASVMNVEPESAGMLAACEQYLTEFHTPAYRPDGWESDIDEKADAEWRLRHLWRTKPEEDHAEADATAGAAP